MNNEQTLIWIEENLKKVFQPSILEITDQTHKHRHHAGAAQGGGHYIVRIKADAFAGKTPLQRHRLIYETLGMPAEPRIHALSLKFVD